MQVVADPLTTESAAEAIASVRMAGVLLVVSLSTRTGRIERGSSVE